MTAPSLAVARLRRVAEYLIDRRVGILAQVREIRGEAGFPDYFQFSAEACNTRAFSPHASHRWTMSASVDREVAAATAVTEAVAAYCSALRRQEDDQRPVTPAASAPFPCVPPEEFALFAREQYEQPDFPYFPFADSTPVHWMPSFDPLRDETVYVPSALAFLPDDAAGIPGEVPIAPPSSTGLACDFGAPRTALRAICDAIQCDAQAITWQARLEPPQIRIETLSDANYDRVARFGRGGGHVTLLLLSLGLAPPTFLAVHRSRVPDAPALVFAAGTDPDPEEGIRLSLESLAHALYYCRMLKAQVPAIEPEPGYGNVREQLHHLRFWCDGDNAPLADFLFASDQRISFDELETDGGSADPRAALRKVLRGLAAAGHRSVLVDLTTPDVRSLGMWVLRAVVPGLQPLYMGHHLRALGGSRLWETPRKLDPRGVDRVADDNPVPHPFSRKGGV